MRFVTLSTLFSLAFAQHAHQSCGVGRFPSDPQLQFSYEALSAAIQSVNDPPTLADPIPVRRVYGLNLGNWLVFEPWMSPDEWVDMGGEHCDDCSKCRRSEWALAQYLGQNQADTAFLQHWQSWFTDADVHEIKGFGINTVRIPLGFWIIEGIVHREEEPYARGGLDQLIRGLDSLKAAGIHVILDHHALPGVSSKGQMFAGNCTQVINFYEEANYRRAATWAAAMTFLIHVHPTFESVFALQAVNEPEMNYGLTPAYERYQKAFVLTVRAIEYSLGIACDSRVVSEAPSDPIARAALMDVVPIIVDLSSKYNWNVPFGSSDSPFITPSGLPPMGTLSSLIGGSNRNCISTNFMTRDWQWSNDPSNPVPNPADVARGPQVYDNHLYFNFGGVAEPNAEAYLKTICNLMSPKDAIAIGNTPLFFGEWSIATNFDTTDDFLRKWGDAQKLMYSKSAGWIFWNWKVLSNTDKRMWSYRDAVNNGIFTSHASDLFDPHVCNAYRNH